MCGHTTRSTHAPLVGIHVLGTFEELLGHQELVIGEIVFGVWLFVGLDECEIGVMMSMTIGRCEEFAHTINKA